MKHHPHQLDIRQYCYCLNVSSLINVMINIVIDIICCSRVFEIMLFGKIKRRRTVITCKTRTESDNFSRIDTQRFSFYCSVYLQANVFVDSLDLQQRA